MISRLWGRIRPHLTIQLFGVVAIFVALAHMGLAFQPQLAGFVAHLSPKGAVLIREPAVIYGLWAAILGVHAAVGAVAPILGYTLMATTITSASRIAPSGAVVAAEIEWSKYLRTSLSLLAGSLIGVLSAPSALGLAAAGAAAVYVVARTLHAFKTGFDLIERPEKFDAGARKYLAAAIANVELKPASGGAQQDLDSLNEHLKARFPELPLGHVVRASLQLGDNFRATQLLRIEKRAVDLLASEAEKLGYQISLLRGPIPLYLPRGSRDFFAVERAEKVQPSGKGAPIAQEKEVPVEPLAIDRLQRVLETSVSFGTSQWIEDFTRLPMLVQRHIATVVYEAIPKEQPHDLSYGLDVLGQIIDEVQSNSSTTKPFDLDIFEWVYDIPLFVCNQIECATHSKYLYARDLVDYLRARLVRWFADPGLDALSRAYVDLLIKLLRCFIGQDDSGAEYLTVAIRELPALARSRRLEVGVMIQRALILLLIEKSDGKVLGRKHREMLLRTMAEVLRYSPGVDKDGVARAETLMSALAVTLFLARQEGLYRDHVADVIGFLVRDRYSDTPFMDLMAAIPRVADMNERWRWSWWELDQKSRGEAHFMSMEIWLTRAAIVVLSDEPWRLVHMGDGDLPDEQTLRAMLRAAEGEEGWLDLLPGDSSQAVRSMAGPLTNLLARREEIVAARVAAAPIDSEKVEKFVKDVMGDIRQNFVRHSEWLSKANVIVLEDDVDIDRQAGIARLLPREWFVPDSALDIPIMLTGAHVGRALIDFELKRIVEALSGDGDSAVKVSSANDSRVWSDAIAMLRSGAAWLLIIGVGISEYDVYESFSALRKEAELLNASIRFETIEAVEPIRQGILIADVVGSFRLTRYRPIPQGRAIYEEELLLSDGGVVSGVAEITPAMQEEWLRNEHENKRTELAKRYANSVLDRTAWSFGVELVEPTTSIFFVVTESKN